MHSPPLPSHSADKAAMLASPPGVCRGASPAGACRVLDLDFDGDVDSTDETKFDALTSGTARHPGLTATGVEQLMAHQGLMFEPEVGSCQNRRRQYDPRKRAFDSRDGLNLLAYEKNSPVVLGDPCGRFVTRIDNWPDSVTIHLSLAFWGAGLPVMQPNPHYGGGCGEPEFVEMPVEVLAQQAAADWQGSPAHRVRGQGYCYLRPVHFSFRAFDATSFLAPACDALTSGAGHDFGGNCSLKLLELFPTSVSVWVRNRIGYVPWGGGRVDGVGGQRMFIHPDYIEHGAYKLLAHELGHVMGLPDRNYGIMGSWNFDNPSLPPIFPPWTPDIASSREPTRCSEVAEVVNANLPPPTLAGCKGTATCVAE